MSADGSRATTRGRGWLQGVVMRTRASIYDGRRTLSFGLGVFLAAIIAFRIGRHAAAFWTIDDAAITYSASYELADHGSLAMYPEGTPVESYSNPLVFFVVTLMRWIGVFDPVTTHIHLEALLFGIMTTLVWSLLRHSRGDVAAAIGAFVFAALELVTPATWVWYGSGLENIWASTGLVAMLWLCVRTARGVPLSPAWGVVGGLAALTRPESPVHVAAFYVALLLSARPPGCTWRAHLWQVVRPGLVTAAIFIAFMCWRRIGYEDWLPNTYYAKLGGGAQVWEHLRKHVVGELLPYYACGLFASSALILVLIRKERALGGSLLILIAGSLALPIMAGNDVWLGHARFATPLLCVAHIGYVALLTACINHLVRREPRRWTMKRAAPVLVVIPLLVLVLGRDKLAMINPTWLNDVTVGRVAQLHGAQRWEQQMRAGIPFPVVMAPDAGGSLLVGGMQFLDNAMLCDFQLARINATVRPDLQTRAANQYQHEERSPDFVSPQKSGRLDWSYLGTRYLPGAGYLYIRRDLAAGQIDPQMQPLVDLGDIRVYLSPRTVPIAAPRGLVRIELLVAWADHPPDGSVRVRASFGAGDQDAIQLTPFAAEPNRVERRALLLGAPDAAGLHEIEIDIERAGQVVFHGTPTAIEVTPDAARWSRAADQIANEPDAREAARRFAWLREQTIPRVSMRAFGKLERALGRLQLSDPRIGRYVTRLRWNARLATMQELPAELRRAEVASLKRFIAECPNTGTDDPARVARAMCLGRAIDQLRRWGYLGVLASMPALAHELREIRALLSHIGLPDRYRALVGLTLADPSDVSLQRELLAARSALAAAGGFPPL